MTDRCGIVLALLISPANVNDGTLLERILDAVPALPTPRGGRRKRPEKLHGDKAYDSRGCRRAVSRRGIKVRIARKGKESSQKLGRHRWVVERTLAWFSRMRRLTIRYERRDDIWTAWHLLAASLINLRVLQQAGFC